MRCPRERHRPARRPTAALFLGHSGLGLGSVAALAGLLARDSAAGSPGRPPVPGVLAQDRTTRPRAKRMISLVMAGGPAQQDLFDHKPAVERPARPASCPTRVRGAASG